MLSPKFHRVSAHKIQSALERMADFVLNHESGDVRVTFNEGIVTSLEARTIERIGP